MKIVDSGFDIWVIPEFYGVATDLPTPPHEQDAKQG